jgi:hypothetical protein
MDERKKKRAVRCALPRLVGGLSLLRGGGSLLRLALRFCMFG